jgi:hypothetical protein
LSEVVELVKEWHCQFFKRRGCQALVPHLHRVNGPRATLFPVSKK